MLKGRITDLKADRDIAWAAAERAKGASRPSAVFEPSKLAAFSQLMRERLTTGEIPFRKACLSALIDRV